MLFYLQVGRFFKKVFSGWKRKREIERMRNQLFEEHIRRRRFLSKIICEGIVGGGCKGRDFFSCFLRLQTVVFDYKFNIPCP